MFPAIPPAAEPLVDAIRGVFTRPTLRRFVLLMGALIITMGRRTVSHALVMIEPLMHGHWSDYHRIYSAARFSMWELAAALVRQVIRLLPKDLVIELVADDTVDGKDGDHVWAKGVHRDSARSSHKVDQVKFGHKWLVLCVLVRLEGLSRPWALPILCGMCISPKVAQQIGARQKTPSDLARQLLIVLMRWLPGRKFILMGDYQVITHKTACFASRHAERVTVIGRLRGDANFYAKPSAKQRRRRVRGGGYCSKGKKLPSPAERVERLDQRRAKVAWYGGSRRSICYASETALWFSKHNCAVLPIVWVCVLGENKGNDYFYSSDPTLSPKRVIELYALRWNIEVTFEETRQLLGLETTRHWCRQSVLRVTPLIFGLFSAVTLMWNELPASQRQACGDSQTPCYHKRAATFADALFAVRHELWEQGLLRHRGQNECLNRLPRRLRQTLLRHLAAAA
jgi:Transposase DDE domain